MITFVGIIGKQDRPLYLKSHGTSNFPEIRLVEWAYSACDIFQERLNTGVNANDFYFGMLTAFDGVVYYGSMSKTGIKFILALQEQTMLISDAMVRSTLQKIHAEYTKAGILLPQLLTTILAIANHASHESLSPLKSR